LGDETGDDSLLWGAMWSRTATGAQSALLVNLMVAKIAFQETGKHVFSLYFRGACLVFFKPFETYELQMQTICNFFRFFRFFRFCNFCRTSLQVSWRTMMMISREERNEDSNTPVPTVLPQFEIPAES